MICRYRKSRIFAVFMFINILFVLGCVNTAYAVGVNESFRDISKENESLDVVFVVDNSESMIKKKEMCNIAMCNAVYCGVGSDIRVGSIYFTNNVHQVHSLRSIEDENSYKEIISNYLNLSDKVKKGNTIISEGLKAGVEMLKDQDRTRKRIIILISDGVNVDYNTLSDSQRELIEREKVELYVALIGENSDSSKFDNLLSYYNVNGNFRVNEDNIDLLSQEFSKIFYSSRGDVRFKTVSLDSDNRYEFFIPKLNVTKLQTYARGSEIRIEVTGPGDSMDYNQWVDEMNAFHTVYNPNPGKWIIEIKGDNPENVKNTKVTMAYYTELSVSAQIKNTDNEENLKKQQQCVLYTSFSDIDGNPVYIDGGADVEAELLVRNPDDNNIVQTEYMKLNLNDGKAVSDSIFIENYGIISVNIYVSYSDYIYLKYKIENINEIKSYAPYTTDNFVSRFIDTKKVDNGKGYKFIINLDEFIKDEDSDLSEIVISDITYENDKNKLLYSQIKDGKLICIAEKFGNIKCSITFEDSTKLKTNLIIEGFILDMGDTFMDIVVFLVIIALVFIVGFLVTKKDKKDKSEKIKKIEKHKKDFNENKKKIFDLKTQSENLLKSEEFNRYESEYNQFNSLLEKNGIYSDELKRMFIGKDIQKPSDIRDAINNLIKEYNKEIQNPENRNIDEIDDISGINEKGLQELDLSLKESVLDIARIYKRLEKDSENIITSIKENLKKSEDIRNRRTDFEEVVFDFNIRVKFNGDSFFGNVKEQHVAFLDDFRVINVYGKLKVKDYLIGTTNIIFTAFQKNVVEKSGQINKKGAKVIFIERQNVAIQNAVDTKNDTNVHIPVEVKENCTVVSILENQKVTVNDGIDTFDIYIN